MFTSKVIFVRSVGMIFWPRWKFTKESLPFSNNTDINYGTAEHNLLLQLLDGSRGRTLLIIFDHPDAIVSTRGILETSLIFIFQTRRPQSTFNMQISRINFHIQCCNETFWSFFLIRKNYLPFKTGANMYLFISSITSSTGSLHAKRPLDEGFVILSKTHG